MPAPDNLFSCHSSDNHQLLEQAIKNLDKEKIAVLLKIGVDCAATNANGETVLHVALKNNPGKENEELIIEIFEIFRNVGVDLNAKDANGRTVLNIAFKNKLTKLTKSLITWGANINEPDIHGNTIAHLLANNSISSSHRSSDQSSKWKNPEYVDWLLSMGLDVDCKNHNRDTPLHLAAKHNFPHILLSFLKYCKDIDAVDNDGQTVFHRFLAQDKTNFSDPAPGVCKSSEKNDVYKQLLIRGFCVDVVDVIGNTPVHVAARLKKIATIKLMMDSFTNVNAKNDRGETVLSILCNIDVKDEGEISSLINTLILKGTNIHLRRKDGLTPVQLAALNKHAAIFKILLEHKADVTVLRCQRSLLHLVCQNASDLSKGDDYTAMIDMLATRGCDVNAKDANGTTPLHLASYTGTPQVIRRLIEHGANVHSREWINSSFTALHMAVRARKIPTIFVLVEKYADVNAKDLIGRTPLHLAARLHDSKITGRLLELGAEVSVKDEKGYPPLYYAIQTYNLIAIKNLLNYEAEINDVVIYNSVMDLDRHEQVLECIMEHWTKLKSVGLSACTYYREHERMISSKFQKKCNNEVEKLKKCPVDTSMSLYKFLHASPNSRCAYTNDVKFCKFIESPDFKWKFLNYHGLILARYYKAQQRKSLLESARLHWYDFTNVHLPDICKYAIFDNLTNMDLKCFTKENTNEEPIVKKDCVVCLENSPKLKRNKRRRH